MKNSLLNTNELESLIISSLQPAATDALSLQVIEKLGGIGDGRPIPEIARKVLTLRSPAWDFPGLWRKEKISSLKGLKITDLIKLILANDEFNPGKYWHLKEFEAALPGKCYLLGLDEPASFYYISPTNRENDYPVLTLIQSDDSLEVVTHAPNLTVYYAMKLGIIKAPAYYGGLAKDATLRDAMIACLKDNGLHPNLTTDRLYWEASRKEVIERAPVIKSVPAELPAWVIEYCAPWLPLAKIAWDKVLKSDDAQLVKAFQACQRESRLTDVEGKRADTIRKRLLAEIDTSSVPLTQFTLLFAVVSELEPENAADFLMKALEVPVDYKHQRIHDWLLSIAARRIYNEKKFWNQIFTPNLTFETTRDSMLYFDIGYGLAKTSLFIDEQYISDIEMIIKRKEEGPLCSNLNPDEKKFIHILMIGLLMRNEEYKDQIEKYGQLYADLLMKKGQENWLTIYKQEMETIFRESGRRFNHQGLL